MKTLDYVFVDEHNRHKRLKGLKSPSNSSYTLVTDSVITIVMRACEGCRRRKIKCDAATTNTWPCSACVRLKLRCVPPMVQYDQDSSASQATLDHQIHGADFRDESSGSGDDDYSQQSSSSGQRKRNTGAMPSYNPQKLHLNYRQVSPPNHHSPGNQGIQYNQLPQHVSAADNLESSMSSMQQFHVASYSPHSSVQQADQWGADDSFSSATASVSGVLAMEQLKIDDSGVGKR